MGRKNLIIWVKFHIIIIQYYCNLKTFKMFFNILSFAIIYNVTDHLFLMSPTGKFDNIYFIHTIKLSVCSFHFRCFYSWTILQRNDSCASCHTGHLHYLFFFLCIFPSLVKGTPQMTKHRCVPLYIIWSCWLKLKFTSTACKYLQILISNYVCHMCKTWLNISIVFSHCI